MKRLKLHLKACVLFTPMIIGFISGAMFVLLLCLIYSIGLYRWSFTKSGRIFLRSYYREIMRLEHML